MSAAEDPQVNLLRVEGMWCTSCARAVEKSLRRMAGVSDAQVSFATKVAVVQGRVSLPDLTRVVRQAGYEAQSWTPSVGIAPLDETVLLGLGMRVAVAVFCTMWVMMLQLVLYVGQLPHEEARWVAVGAGILATPVVFVAGGRIILAGYRTLRALVPGMDTVVALGALSAWTLSIAELMSGSSDVWFDTAAMLITLLLVGRLLQARVQARGDAAVAEALGDTPERVCRVVDGHSVEVEARALRMGDRVSAACGDTLAVDGVVVAGSASIDRAALTGESVPALVQSGALVFAGERLLAGAIELSVQATVGIRRIDGLREQVRNALGQRSELLSTADRFAERLIPAVVVIALSVGVLVGVSTGDVSQAALRCVTVLVVTCPCAIGLAAPLALSVAVSAAARRGIVFRSYDALERAATVDTIVFDKTGTLTEGRVSLVGFESASGGYDEALQAAASAEWGIEHPIASAIREAARQRGIALDSAGRRAVMPGQGVTWVRPDGREVRVGRPEWALGDASDVASSAATGPADGAAPRTPTSNVLAEVAVHVSGGPAGRWMVQDRLRPDAQSALDELRAAGFTVSMWSGDAAGPAATVADTLGISDARAEQSPEDKADGVRGLAAKGLRVAFVGDGANDAPALSEAYLGVASVGAVEAAMSAAPVVLLGGGVRAVTVGLSLARSTRQIVRQNLAWALVYNLAALPLAATGLISPVVAAGAMLLSSLTVAVNAARLSTGR